MPAPIAIVLLVYGFALLGIGLWSRRASRDVAGYYVAGKRLPSWVIAFSTNATGESAWLLLGLTGMGYAIGIHALWIVFGEVLGVTLGWVWVASRFKEYTDRYDSVTVPDFLESRFKDTTHIFRWVSLIIIFSMVTAYTAAQFNALGTAFNSFLNFERVTGILIAAAIILFYTAVGGLQAVAYSDLLQGVLMFLGLLVLPFVGLGAAGGWSETMTVLRAEDPALLAPMGTFGLTLPGVISVISFVAIGFAFLGAPQLLVRFMSARSQRDIVDGGLIAVIAVIVFDLGAVFAGMAGRAVFPGLADPETILPVMTTELFPAVFTGIFLVIVLAASMSTVDSLVLLASSVIARDIIQKDLQTPADPRPDIDDRQGHNCRDRSSGRRFRSGRSPGHFLFCSLRLGGPGVGVHAGHIVCSVLEADDEGRGRCRNGCRICRRNGVGGVAEVDDVRPL